VLPESTWIIPRTDSQPRGPRVGAPIDANGNLTSDGTRTFEWDARNQVMAVNVWTHRTEFTYDREQRRVRVVEKENGVANRRGSRWHLEFKPASLNREPSRPKPFVTPAKHARRDRDAEDEHQHEDGNVAGVSGPPLAAPDPSQQRHGVGQRQRARD
jgi:hypothetical protein